MIKKNKRFLRFSLTLACLVATGAVLAGQRVQLDNGTSFSATEVARVDGDWLTFKLHDGSQAVALTTVDGANLPTVDGWDDAVLMLRGGGVVELRGPVDRQGANLVFKQRDGLAVMLPVSQVATVTGLRKVRPRPKAEVVVTPPDSIITSAVAITNEDLPEVDDPSPELPAEGEVAEENPEEGESKAAAKPAEDEDWWRSEIERLNSKVEQAQKRIYAAFTDRKALNAEVEAGGGFESDEQKQRRQKIDRRLRRAEKQRDAAKAEKTKLQRDARKANVPEEWLRGS